MEPAFEQEMKDGYALSEPGLVLGSPFLGNETLKGTPVQLAQSMVNRHGLIAGATGTISGSSLEGSNTDIADEFTKLIVTQQAYSANTKVITTANQMSQDLLNVIR